METEPASRRKEMLMFWRKSLVIGITAGLTCGLLGQFTWKLYYFPEPVIPLFFELTGIVALATISILQTLQLCQKGGRC
jgi:hypothetical protein